MTKDLASDIPANRAPLAERMKKLTETLRMRVSKPYGDDKDGIEVHEAMDGGTVVSTTVKKDGEVLSHSASADLQESGQSEKVEKAVGAKKGDTTPTKPVQSAMKTSGEEQLTPERKKEGETHESETKEKIKAPDSKEKKPKEKTPEAKKPDNSMSKMASGESADTQGAAPLAKNYNIKRVGDTLQYSRLGDDKKNKGQANAPIVPPHATQTPNQVATKPPSTGPDQARGTAASPQQPPAPEPKASPSTVAPTAKKAPSDRWKKMFEARKQTRDMSKIAGGKGYVTSKGTVMVKSEDEPLKKDVVKFEKPNKPHTEHPGNTTAEKMASRGKELAAINGKQSGLNGMFDVLKRGRSQVKPGTREEKIAAALKGQEATNPYTKPAESRGVQPERTYPSTGGEDNTVQPGAREAAIARAKAKKDGPAATVSNLYTDQKPVLVRDLGRMSRHTQTGRPFRVMMATHEDHADLPGHHMQLNEPHTITKARDQLSDPMSDVNKHVINAMERGHDTLILHNPKSKAAK